MNKWLSRIKTGNLKNHLLSGDNVDDASNTLTLSTMSPPIPCVSGKESFITDCKEQEIRLLIRKISDYHGGDDEKFLEAYINDVISKWSHALDEAQQCFFDIILKCNI